MDTRRPGRLNLTVDASVVSSWVIPEKSVAEAAFRLREDWANGEVTLYATPHTRYEVLNAVWKAAKRRSMSRIDAVMASEALAEDAPEEVKLSAGEAAEAMEIAIDNDLEFYDAAYISVARLTRTRLVTADKTQLATAKKYVQALNIEEY